MMDCFEFGDLRDDIETIIQENIIDTLDGQVYDHHQLNEWVQKINTQCVEDLTKISQVGTLPAAVDALSNHINDRILNTS